MCVSQKALKNFKMVENYLLVCRGDEKIKLLFSYLSYQRKYLSIDEIQVSDPHNLKMKFYSI